MHIFDTDRCAAPPTRFDFHERFHRLLPSPTRTATLLVAATLVGPGCPPVARGQDVGLDVNDASVLLGARIDRTDPRQYLNIASPAGRGRVVPNALWQPYATFLAASTVNVYEIALDGTPQNPTSVPGPGLSLDARIAPPQLANRNPTRFRLDDPAVWALTAVRFDPCSPQSRVQNTACVPQLRLVMQPAPQVTPADFTDPDAVADQSIHLIYDLALPGPVDDVDAVQTRLALTVLRLKQDAEALGPITNGVALGVHPAMASNPAAYRRRVEDTIVRILSGGSFAATLKEIAFHGLDTAPGVSRWLFFTARVVGGELFPVGFFFQPRPVAVELRRANLAFTPDTPVSPQYTDGRPQAADLFNPAFYDLNSSRLAATFARFNDPRRTAGLVNDQDNPGSITCLACHSATNTLR